MVDPSSAVAVVDAITNEDRTVQNTPSRPLLLETVERSRRST
jgi:hypothetical protein